MADEQQLIDRVLSSPQLPSLPAIALEIISMVQDDEADVDKIAETISLDPALSSKMLKTVNSSFYGLPKTIASVNQAVIVLGLNSVKTLALGFSLVNNLAEAGGQGFDHLAFWRRSLYSAAAAKQLCDQLSIIQAEEVFIATLLQDVGVMALAQVLEGEYGAVTKSIEGDHRKLSAAEREAFGIDHLEVGAALAESWSLPPLLVEAIRLHETPEQATENVRPLIRTVYAGGLAADLIEQPDDAERVTDYNDVLRTQLGMSKADGETLIKTVFKHTKEMQRLFELPTGDLGYPEDILSRANQTLERLSLDAVHENEELKQVNEELQQSAQLDAVTGLLNRRQFDEQLDERFMTAGKKAPLSVVFLDLDGFKQINDSYGHPAGDELLVALARSLSRVAENRGQVYRYGGDEFVVLCAGLGLQHAAALGEDLRAAIEKTQCEVLDDHDQPTPISLTASIGVASYEGAVFKRPMQLVRAADKGVYAAKQQGRNAVRVFVPKASGSSQAA